MIAIGGEGPIPGKEMVQVVVAVEFEGPLETGTFTMVVANSTDIESLKIMAIAKAKERAARFLRNDF